MYMVNRYEHIGITWFFAIPKQWQECKNRVAYVSYWATTWQSLSNRVAHDKSKWVNNGRAFHFTSQTIMH
jgi:hypothetical protein